jgi:hypothetical protein
MGWVRLDDNFADHPKVIALSDTGFRLYIEALCYSNRQLTDGFIPMAVYTKLSKQDEADYLIEAGLWEEVHGNVISPDLLTGYQIRSYTEYQPTREKIEEKREQAKERLRKYRESQKGNADETQMKRHPQPNPTQPNPTQIDIKDNYYLETIHEEERDEHALTPAPRVKLAKEAVGRIAEKLQNASANGINAWNLSKLVEEEWDKFDPVNEVGACIALTVWYVSELQSRTLTSAEIARIGQMTKRFGRISLLAIDEAASKDLDDLVSYAFRVAQRMYADRKA